MVKLGLALIFATFLFGIAFAEQTSDNSPTETSLTDAVAQSRVIGLIRWLRQSKAILRNDVQCLLAAVLTVLRETHSQVGWVISVIRRIRALEEALNNCENLSTEFGRRQCRAATEALQVANFGVIALELALRVYRFPTFREDLSNDRQECRDTVSRLLSEYPDESEPTVNYENAK